MQKIIIVNVIQKMKGFCQLCITVLMSLNILQQIFKWMFLKNILKFIKNSKFCFLYMQLNLKKILKSQKNKKKFYLLLMMRLSSFYNEAWPYLKKNEIPFTVICFYSTNWQKRIYDVGANKRN